MSLTELQSEIAQLSAAELEALRSTIETELLKKTPREPATFAEHAASLRGTITLHFRAGTTTSRLKRGTQSAMTHRFDTKAWIPPGGNSSRHGRQGRYGRMRNLCVRCGLGVRLLRRRQESSHEVLRPHPCAERDAGERVAASAVTPNSRNRDLGDRRPPVKPFNLLSAGPLRTRHCLDFPTQSRTTAR